MQIPEATSIIQSPPSQTLIFISGWWKRWRTVMTRQRSLHLLVFWGNEVCQFFLVIMHFSMKWFLEYPSLLSDYDLKVVSSSNNTYQERICVLDQSQRSQRRLDWSCGHRHCTRAGKHYFCGFYMLLMAPSPVCLSFNPSIALKSKFSRCF